MDCRLSKEMIVSYVGDIVTLRLEAKKDISRENIKWSTTGECLVIREFSGDDRHAFNDGVLVTVIKVGEGTVSAEYCGQKYTCIVKGVKSGAKDNGELKFYRGDLHVHTSMIHDHDLFAERMEELPCDCLKSAYECGELDFTVLSDHASTNNDRNFFCCFEEAEKDEYDGMVIFPGCESEVTIIEKDRFGYSHKNSGEIVTLNAHGYADSYTWEDFYSKLQDSPFAKAVLAHPGVVGWDDNGIWNFSLDINSNNPEFRRLVKLVEMGNGKYDESSMLYHYTYSQALDCGLKIAPCSTSDSHGAYKPAPAKTIIVSTGKSREAFAEAIDNHRVYACDTGVVQLIFTVNDHGMGETLPVTQLYRFHVEAELMRNVADAMPVKLCVISDYGKRIKEMSFDGEADFEIKSDSARFFYVMLVDKLGRKTWSAPVWTGRAFDDYSYISELRPICKKDFEATDEKTGKSAQAVISDNPGDVWDSGDTSASVVIDMKSEKEICAVGHVAPPVLRFELNDAGINIEDKVTEFVAQYRVSASCDGENYSVLREGCIRVFGGEDMITFEPVKARYIRFEALTSTGRDSEVAKFADAVIKIGELSVFER